MSDSLKAKALEATAVNMLHLACGIQALRANDKRRIELQIEELLEVVREVPLCGHKEKSVWVQG